MATTDAARLSAILSAKVQGDGVEYTGPADYGWATFPPVGLSPNEPMGPGLGK